MNLPSPGGSVAERTLQMVTALAAEVAVLRERLEVVEMISEQRGLLSREDIDAFSPDAETAGRLREARLALIDRVFHALKVRPEDEVAA